jgi:hypothetical protein
MPELTNILIIVASALFGTLQLLVMYILKDLQIEIKYLRQRVHDLTETVIRLDTLFEHAQKDLPHVK